MSNVAVLSALIAEECARLRKDNKRLAQAMEEAERALEEIADGTVGLDKAGHYLAHRKAVNAARSALTRIRAAKGGE